MVQQKYDIPRPEHQDMCVEISLHLCTYRRSDTNGKTDIYSYNSHDKRCNHFLESRSHMIHDQTKDSDAPHTQINDENTVSTLHDVRSRKSIPHSITRQSINQ